MKHLTLNTSPWSRRPRATSRRQQASGSVLVIVLWIAFGLVSIALYFGHTMVFELRASDNRVGAVEADQAINGAICYVSNILMTAQIQGTLPDPVTYRREAVPVGEAAFWLIGRPDQVANSGRVDQPYFELIDESSKLNLNSATTDMLLWLPRMTEQLAAAIADWRDSDSEVTQNGAEDESYQRLNPPYRCKNANFEFPEELRLVYGMDLDVLYGEDANLNGVLDPNENDADQSAPRDNRDGRLDPGLLEYLTVFTKMPTTRTNGSARVSVTSTNQEQISSLLTEKFDSERASQIMTQLGYSSGSPGGGGRGGASGGGRGGQGTVVVVPTFSSVLEFYMRSGMTPAEFTQIESDLMGSTNTTGLVNVNSASEVVLSAIPGIGLENAPALVAYRRNNRSSLLTNPTLTWVADILSATNAVQAGPYLTGQSYQFTADIAAVGHYGRGYRRVRVVFDTSQGTPRVVFRQDLTSSGWALGSEIRQSLLLLAKNKQ